MRRTDGRSALLCFSRTSHLVRRTTFLLTLLLSARLAVAQDHVHSAPGGMAPGHSMNNNDLPADDEHASERVRKSHRHGEVVELGEGASNVEALIVFPERRSGAAVAVVIVDDSGFGDWVRAVADQFAAEGFITLVPDLAALRDDSREIVNRRIDAVREFGLGLRAASGRTAVVGLGPGASIAVAYAAAQPNVNAAVVYYGAAPDSVDAIAAPMLGLYGAESATTRDALLAGATRVRERSKVFEYEIYDGAVSGFLRTQMASAANMAATEKAWPRMIAFLRKYAER